MFISFKIRVMFKMVNSTSEQSRIRSSIKGGRGGLLDTYRSLISKIVSIDIHMHYIFFMKVTVQQSSVSQNKLDPSFFSLIIIYDLVERSYFAVIELSEHNKNKTEILVTCTTFVPFKH